MIINFGIKKHLPPMNIPNLWAHNFLENYSCIHLPMAKLLNEPLMINPTLISDIPRIVTSKFLPAINSNEFALINWPFNSFS